MNPDELRALADALCVRHYDLATVDVIRAADYLRACADARLAASAIQTRLWERPIISGWDESTFKLNEEVALYTHPAPAAPHYAMLDSHRRQVEQAIQSAEHPSGMSTHDGKARIDASILRRMLAIIDSLPAAPKEENNVWKQIIPDDAPQAEPKREPNPDEVICPACTHQFRAIPENVQAQLWAKREPLSDEQIDTALQTYPATLLALMGGEMTVGEFKSALRRLARTVEHAHGISGGGHD